MSLRLISGPDAAARIVSVDEAKLYLRYDSTDSDELIDSLVDAARRHIEGPGHLNRVFLEQSWELVLDKFPADDIRLPLAPVQSIIQIAYDDEDGVEQIVNSDDYYFDGVKTPSWVVPVSDFSWPTVLRAANAVRVRFLAGYAPSTESESGENAAAKNIPQDVRLAVKMLVQHWFDNRGVVGDGNWELLPFTVKQILQRYRVFL